MTRFQKNLPWIAEIVIASLLMGSLALFAGLQYTGNDDAAILHAFMGYSGGEPSQFILRMHAAFSLLLYALARLWPGVAWFSILQLFLLWFSQVIIVKSLMQAARHSGWPLWAGAAAGTVFLTVFTLYVSCRITFTVTSALCGAAAVFQLASVDFSQSRGRVISGVLGGAALLFGCYFMRMSAAAPSACFFVLLFIFKYFAMRSRPALTALLIAALLFAGLAGAQALSVRGMADDIAWQSARTKLYDYTGFPQETSDETLEALGWSRDQLWLVQNWFFLNDNITAEAFRTLADQQAAAEAAAFGPRLAAAWRTVATLFTESRLRLALWCLLLAALAAALRGTKRTATYLLATLTCGLLLLMALAYLGRLPVRAAFCVLLPAAAAVFSALFAGTADDKPSHTRALLAMAPLSACLVLCVLAGIAQADASHIKPNPYFTDTTTDLHADLDEIARMNPDKLIIYDLSLSDDHRLFPDTSEGVPDNLMLWGGWTAHTPVWRAQLEKFGVTALDPALFLRDNVLYASTYDQPTPEMTRYIGEGADFAVDWFYYDQWGYVVLFEFDSF